MYRIKLSSNWTDTASLHELWSRQMTHPHTRLWFAPDHSGGIILVEDDTYDREIIINGVVDRSPSECSQDSRTLYFPMEPYLTENHGDWCRAAEWFPPERCFMHSREHNLGEWHIGHTLSELQNHPFQGTQKTSLLSAIQSCKDYDPGHVLRLQFVRDLATRLPDQVHVFGSFNSPEIRHHKGGLPSHNKQDGLVPYKYHFAVENNDIPNYFTEKILDGILCECLVFYWGCSNLEDYLPSGSFIRLDLNDWEGSLDLIERAIREDWWSKHLDQIRAAKTVILEKLQVFPHIYRILGPK